MQLAGPAATEQLGCSLAAQLVVGDIIALFGPLGAGKTVFARGLLRGLGFAGDVTSPTFPIVQIYDSSAMRLPLWHVDLYRIEMPSELEELGLDEAREQGVLVVEWPERLGAALWSGCLELHLADAGPGVRALTARVPPAWEGRWPPQ